MGSVKWTHDDINSKIQEAMNLKQPGKDKTVEKPNLSGVLGMVKKIPGNIFGRKSQTSPGVPPQAGQNLQAG